MAWSAGRAVPKESRPAGRRIQAENRRQRRYDGSMAPEPTRRPGFPALAVSVVLALAATAACKPMKPRPTPPPPPAPAEPEKKEAATGPTERKSHLGKAMDAAERTRDRVNAYQDEVSKQADEVFKNP